ncbi:Transcriptional activator hacA [Trichophyton interdigitale]|uniref:Transcriptional activator hacA n=1 Tax=Trichophyton interdigitale TaxID=101480 RepID=A0A9P4YJB9_9EURO|nr:Transcriptional activator hacA [Trichophyton interdigitale]KAF3897236.1 Transcriptional activator hacA [Trichophyton interdigitale]KAG8209791.1 Transcriptional activator hacA [Trichophyton interdigitale]
MTESTFAVETFSMDSMSPSPGAEIPRLTVSPADTTLKFEDVVPEGLPKVDTPKPAEKKPVKKRKSWGQELPTPKTNLPPRKRAKTEDEKEQRRIERVLRNRAAAQISRERKRLEIEKLEGEKLKIEQQNEFLLRRLSQMEAENNRLSQQVAKLASEIQTSKSNPGSPASASASASSTSNISATLAPSTSPTLAPVLFKQENDLLDNIDSIPFTTNPDTTTTTTTATTTSSHITSTSSTTLSPADLDHSSAAPSDLTQHPAAVFHLNIPLLHEHDHVHPPPLSDADLSRLFDADSSSEPDLSFLEDGFSLELLPDSDLGPFAFDSLVDLGPDEDNQQQQQLQQKLDDSIGFPEQTPLPASGLQPGFGASLERCDEQGIAAGAQ